MTKSADLIKQNLALVDKLCNCCVQVNNEEDSIKVSWIRAGK